MHGLIGANFALPVCSTIINLSNALTTEDDATGPINVYGRHRLASTRATTLLGCRPRPVAEGLAALCGEA